MTVDNESLKSFLVGTPFFGGVEEAALDLLTSMLVEKRLPAGSNVFTEGDTGRSMYIIERGEVLMTRMGESGLQVKLVRLGQGDFFGETTLIEMQPRPCSARAETEVTLLELSNMSLYRLYREDVKAYVMVLQNINRELCRRLRRADCRITEMADEDRDEETQIRPMLRR
jgi:CRP/FNR family cyclic AMP-dependent transcriptional regulator